MNWKILETRDEKRVVPTRFGNGHNLKYDVIEIAIALIPELPSYMICRLYLHINCSTCMRYFTNMWSWLYENRTKATLILHRPKPWYLHLESMITYSLSWCKQTTTRSRAKVRVLLFNQFSKDTSIHAMFTRPCRLKLLLKRKSSYFPPSIWYFY